MLDYKTFRGKNFAEALMKMKMELGSNGIILNQREVKPGGIWGFFKKPEIEIVAVRSNKPNSYSSLIQHSSKKESENFELANVLQKELSEIKSKLELLLDEKREIVKPEVKFNRYQHYINHLKEHDIGDDIIEKIFESIEKEGNINFENDERIIKEKIRRRIIDLIETTGPIKLDKQGRVFMFVGPTGMGKTTTLVKIGANYRLKNNKNIEIITLDNYRIGASQQLKAYCEIMQSPYRKVSDKKELKAIVKKSQADLILIDTAGRSHYDDMSISTLTSFIKELNMHNLDVFLVVSANTKKRDILEISEKYSKTNYKYLIYTKLDETASTGAIIDATYRIKKPISFITFGQDVPKHIDIATPEYIVKYIMKEI